MIRARIDAIARLRGLLDGALAVTAGLPHRRPRTPGRVRDFFAFFEKEYPLLFARWEEEGGNVLSRSRYNDTLHGARPCALHLRLRRAQPDSRRDRAALPKTS